MRFQWEFVWKRSHTRLLRRSIDIPLWFNCLHCGCLLRNDLEISEKLSKDDEEIQTIELNILVKSRIGHKKIAYCAVFQNGTKSKYKQMHITHTIECDKYKLRYKVFAQ